MSVPGYAIDRMCAGAMTAVTTSPATVALGAADIAIAGGVEHMGRHPMGEGVDPNPRFLSEQLVDESALFMGDDGGEPARPVPGHHQGARRRVRARQPAKVAAAYAAGKLQPDLVPMAIRDRRSSAGAGRRVDEPPRPETTLRGPAPR